MANLADLRDAENSFRIEVSGRFRPGVLQDHDTLAAEIVVASSFVSGRLRVWIRPAELQAWQGVLSVLREGKPATWLDQGNGPVVAFDFPDGRGAPPGGSAPPRARGRRRGAAARSG
ncbi:DUF5959 family protein, partial [Streptomyces sp. NPDC059524]|uniref:DUF5959 family protein n=1 Tax=Streptomyces sp. NPDC059524 TaxID=3346856 RepID=UPI0036790F5C